MQYYKSNRRLPLLVRGFAVLCAALAMAAAGSASAAPTETVLHSFTGRDGSIPSGGLIVWHDANWRCGELGMQRVRMRRGVQALAGRDRDGAALLYRQRRGFSPSRPDCRPRRQSLWHDTDGGASNVGVVFKLSGTGFVP